MGFLSYTILVEGAVAHFKTVVLILLDVVLREQNELVRIVVG